MVDQANQAILETKEKFHGMESPIVTPTKKFRAKTSMRNFVKTVFVITKARFLWIPLNVVTL